ncbi:Ig-like domain repeat protein [Methanobrevibacter sp.]
MSLSFASDVDDVQLGDGNSNFTQLQKDIDESDDVFDLEKNYFCEDDFKQTGVDVSRDLTIEGHNFTVNSLNRSAIFNVNSKNVNFTNVNFADSQNALVATGESSIVFKDCTFRNAGVNFTGVNLTFINCEFMENSFVNANAVTVDISNSKFHDLHVLDNALAINASNVLFRDNIFENNFAYNLSGDTLYVGGFASLINISSGNAKFFNNKFRNNNLKYIIYSINGTDLLIDDFTVEDCDFKAIKVTDNIRKNIPGDATIIAGNFTNIEMNKAVLNNIQSSNSASLINVNVVGDIIIKNTKFTNLSCPYGFIEIYDHASNPVRGTVLFDNCTFKNIDTAYNMTYYDWDSEKEQYIWDYTHGSGNGIKIDCIYDAGYADYINKDLYLNNINMENVEGGPYYFDLSSINLNITNFNITNSKIGKTVPIIENEYYIEGILFYGYCNGNVTLKNILQDNVGVLDYNHTSYNSTLGKYLCDDYIVDAGGAGIRITAGENMDIFNVNITNSVGSDLGILVFESMGKLTADNILVENVSGGECIGLDKYYPDLDLQTFFYSGKYYMGLGKFSTEDDVSVSNLKIKNASFGGYYSWYGPSQESLSMVGKNAVVENITVLDCESTGSTPFYIEAGNVTVNHVLMNNFRGYGFTNESHYDAQLGEYIWKYSSNFAPSEMVIDADELARVSDINMTNCERGMDNLLAISADKILLDRVIIENVTDTKIMQVEYDPNYGYIYESENYAGVYEGVLSLESQHDMDISNINITNIVATDLGNVAEILSRNLTEGYINLENITVINVLPLHHVHTKFNKELGQYITIQSCGGDDHSSFYIGGGHSISMVNFNVKNMNGFQSIFDISSHTVSIQDSSFENMSSYSYWEKFDEKRNRTVLWHEDNFGSFMNLNVYEVHVYDSTFKDLKFSNEAFHGSSGIIVVENSDYYNKFTNDKFINCTVDQAYYRDYDEETGEYRVTYEQNQGSVINFCDSSLDDIINTDFINCTAIKGGAIYIEGDPYGFLDIWDCRFYSNSAKDGGAIYVSGDTRVELKTTTFFNNTADNGGAIYFNGYSMEIHNSNFFNNTAQNGGAIYCGGNSIYASDLQFRYNKAGTGSALYVDCELTLVSSTLLDNQALSKSLVFTSDITDKNISVSVSFTGMDNFINAIYTRQSCYLSDVTYWTSSGETNSDIDNPTISDLEDGINITIELFDFTFTPIKTVHNNTVNGHASLFMDDIKNNRYVLRVRHAEDNYYTEISNSQMIQVGLLDAPIDLKADNVNYKENATINVKLPKDAKGNVTFEIDGVNYTTKNLTDGFATVDKSGLEGGIHNVTVYYSGDDTYLANSTKIKFSVNPISAILIIATDGGDYKSNIAVNATLQDGAQGEVIIVIEDEFGHDLRINGTNKLQAIVNSLNSGKYNVTGYYLGNNNYLSCENSTVLIVNPIDLNPEANASDVNNMQNTTFSINVPDDFNGTVEITVDNVPKTFHIAGPTQISGENLTVGNKTAKLRFFNDANYHEVSITANFTVNKYVMPQGENITINITSIKAEDMTRGYNSEFDYEAVFLDKNGEALKNTQVRFIINGKAYSAITDDEGIAHLTNAKLPVGKYSITSINDFTGENVTYKLEIVKRITENKDLTMDYLDGSRFVVKVYGDDGKIAPEGEIISITANGVHYVAKVDKNGYASLKIKLLPKTYNVISEYKGFKTTNKLVVKQTIKAVKKTTKVKKGKKFVLKAKLVWSNGKGIKGKVIKFKFKGKTYKAKTDKKGIAKVTIKKKVTKKLKRGKKYKVGVIYSVKHKFGNGYQTIDDNIKIYVKVKK